MLLSVLFGAAVGIVLGLTGAGGGILAVPALVLGLGLTMTDAAPVALIAVGAAAMLGCADGLRKGIVRYKAALLMAVLGSLLSPVGVLIAHRMSNPSLMIMFSAVMLIVAFRMAREALAGTDTAANPAYVEKIEKNCMLNPATGKLRWNLKCSGTLAAVGSVCGLFTGLLGVGGGFLIVPAFKQFSDVGMHGIVATSLMVIALISASAVAAAILSGADISLIGWFFIVSAGVGMLIGRLAAPHVPGRSLQIGFSLLAAVVAGMLIVRTVYPEISGGV